MLKPNSQEFVRREVHSNTSRAQLTLERLINGTPTGERRNKLTEANIHLMAAKQALNEAFGLPMEMP